MLPITFDKQRLSEVNKAARNTRPLVHQSSKKFIKGQTTARQVLNSPTTQKRITAREFSQQLNQSIGCCRIV